MGREWSLFGVPGCPGGLPAVAVCSGEVALALARGDFAAGLGLAALHLLGSLLLTWLGMITFRLVAG